MTKVLFYLIILFIISIHGIEIDTLLCGNGTPGPYILGNRLIDPESIQITYHDTALGTIPPYTFIEVTNTLFFSGFIDSGVVVKVHYRSLFSGLNKISYLYQAHSAPLIDTQFTPTEQNNVGELSGLHDNLTVTGFKSVGISFGNQGQLNMEQALDVKISGTLRPHTELTANLSDQGTSLQTQTRELSEIDRLYVTLNHPNYTITVGDQYVTLLPQGILKGNKKIKGFSASAKLPYLHTTGVAAISGGKFTTQTIQGKLGFQGPYLLTGSGETDIITPLAGTVEVSLNGKKLTEGEDKDYLIDYDLSLVRFTPRCPITDNDIIVTSYEYKSFNYQRNFAAFSSNAHTVDSALSLNSVLWYESDDKDHPIELTLDEQTIQGMKQSPDAAPLIPTGKKVPPTEVTKQDAVTRLYKINTSLSTQQSVVYEFSPFNKEQPQNTSDFYIVWFRQVQDNTGDYIRFDRKKDTLLLKNLSSIAQKLLVDPNFDKDVRGPVYIYVGKKKGNYSAFSQVSAPMRLISAESQFSFKQGQWFQLSADIAGQYQNKNLFSRVKSHHTQTGLASLLFLGKKEILEQSGFVSVSFSNASNAFSNKVISDFEKKYFWNIESLDSTQHTAWNVVSGATVLPHMALSTSYGQYHSFHSLQTHRIGYGTQLHFPDSWNCLYSGRLLSQPKKANYIRGDSITFDLIKGLTQYSLYLSDEIHSKSPTVSGIAATGGISLQYKPLNMTQTLFYTKQRKGDGSLINPLSRKSIDTGSILSIKQSINCSPLPWWNSMVTGSYEQINKKRQQTSDAHKTALLVSTTHSFSSIEEGLSASVSYNLNSEQASSIVQIPIFVGKGQGTHKYDTLTGEYILDKLGEYIITEKEIFNSNETENLKKTGLEVNWYYRPHVPKLKGILSDLSFSGICSINEQIRSDSTMLQKGTFPKTIWIPGYTSISGTFDKMISVAELSYKQDIDWRPMDYDGWHGNCYYKPYLRKIRMLKELGTEYGILIDKQFEILFVSAEFKHLSLQRQEYYLPQPVWIIDRTIFFRQRYPLSKHITFFTNEIGGIASRNTSSGPYYRLNPGIRMTLFGKGFGEISYTWSDVLFTGYLEYPMAQGFSARTSHTIDAFIDINAGSNLIVTGSYRGEQNFFMNKRWIHVISLQVKALL